ncbi:NusG domain II-containing protein [Alkalibacter mobilis]|uniref:NusG domain II-containing protein n=1 Tax=Alkalibacter mobilis TaxID=2787712 RepID=UPI00189EB162|nr:NusG domain II-containing protein [Alkalibacter mobilis]MBF7097045.1 NusG domain II-containing protein [Alkalibacter mobilis]
MKKKDLILIGSILIIAMVGLLISYIYGQTDKELKVVITVNGEIYREIPFDETTNEKITVEYEGNLNIVEIKEGHVVISEANCPDQICVHTSPADEKGEMIVCLPNKVIVEVTSNE